MRSKTIRLVLLAAAALLALAAALLVLRPGGASMAGLRGGEELNVVLITLDTTRADRIRCYGFPDIETPTIDRFAREGIRFERCFAQTPLTLPSHTTIMTGTYPPYHGVRDNGGFIVPPSLKTLAESFKERRYQTAAFVAAYVLDSKWGLNQGFDYYFDNFDLSRFETISLGAVQRPANEVMDEALSWMDKAKGGKFFSWIHLYDPHTPYEPPAPFDKKFRHPYLGEIAFADSQIGRLWDFLERNKLRDKTLIVFAADHGESLGAHQEGSHGFFIYQETLHVPLIVVTPFGRLKNVVSPQVVTLADVMPTILDMAGLPIPAEVQGRSLVPLFFDPNKEIPGLGFAYSETYYPRFHYGWSDLKSYQDRRFKLILAPDLELYDVANDPQEQKNLAAENPQAARDLYAKATQFLEQMSRNAVSQDLTKMDEETKQRLAALGYVGSFADTSKLEGKTLLNPREKIGVFNALNKSREMGMEGKADEAIRDILAIIADDPELVDAYFTLGNVLYKEKRYKDSLQAFRQALELKPDDSFTVINMANCLAALGRADEAEKAILDFLAKGFQDSQLYHLLGGLNFARKRYDQAIGYFEKCLSLNSESAASHNSLAAIYIVKGDLDKAEFHIQEALKTNPRLHTLYFNWAQLYEKKNDLTKAAEAYLKEIEISPRNFRACFNLARVYRQVGRDEDELAYLNKTKALNPDFPLTYFYLARIDLNRSQDYNDAVALVLKGLALKPEASDLPLGYFLLADLYNRLGQDALSQEYARKGQEASRANPPQR
jgi:arylsulfatase A-like enzyme/predicted Zn-dependent protease